MGILEKEGNKIAAILSAASALAAGFSVVTMAQTLNAHDKTASLVKSTDHTSASAELTGEVFINESKPQTGYENQIPEQSASEADPELNVVESEGEQPETVPAIEMMYDQDEEVVLYDGTLPQETAQPEEIEAAPAVQTPVEAAALYTEVQADPALAYEPAALEAAPVYEEANALVYEEAPAIAPAEQTVVPDPSYVPEAEQASAAEVPAEAPVYEEAPAPEALQETVLPDPALEVPAAQEIPAVEEASVVEEAPVVEEVPTEYMADEMYVSDGPIAEVPIDQETPVVEVAEEQPAPADPGYADPGYVDSGYVEVPADDMVYDPSVSVDVQAPAQSSDLNARIAEEALKLVDVTNGMQCTDVVALAMSNAGVSDALSVWPNEYEAMYGYATDDPQPGNLIYYNQGGNGLDHIAIYVGDGQAVHGNYSDDTGSSMTVVGNVALPGYDDYTFIQVDR